MNYVEIMSPSLCANKTRALLDGLLVFYDGGLSQTHRVFEGGRACLKSSGPTPQSRHLELVAQYCVQTASGSCQGWRHHSISGQPVPVLSNPHSETGFLVLRRNLLSCAVCPLSLVLSLGTPGRSLALSCLQPPPGYLWNCWRDPTEPSLQVEQFLLLQLLVIGEMLPPLYHLCDRLRDCLQCAQVSPTGSPELVIPPGVASSMKLNKGQGSPPALPAGNASPAAAQVTVSCLCSHSSFLVHVHLGDHHDSRFFSAKLLSIWVACSTGWCLGLFLPWCRTLHLP